MIARTSFLFGRFRLSTDGTMLLRDGAVVPLAPKALRTLLTLVEHAGEVVTKQQLLETVWPDSFVEDTGLTRNISVIRQALGDSGEQHITTVARLGYRFVTPVQRVDSGSTSRATRTRPAHNRDRRGPVVGRTDELEVLQSAFDAAVERPGRVIAVTGEPGIGKTTVIDSFLRQIDGHGHVGRGRCSERLAGAEAHLPVLEALAELTSQAPALMQILARNAPTWLRLIAPRSPLRAGVVDASEQDAKNSERLMWELTTFLEEASAEEPLVLVLEDLHWTDVSTIDVLTHVAARMSRLRLLVIITYRHHELAFRDHAFMPVRAELLARGQLEELPVSLLTSDEVREYVLSILHDAPIPAELPALVFRKTEGNPLFMADLVRYLQKARPPVAKADDVLDVPDSLRALIDRTLRGLQPEARQLASIAAVEGHEFNSATLARVSDTPAADVEDILKRLDEVHALVKRDRETTLPDGTLTVTYRFVHVLYQDALNDSIAPSKRVEWARRIAQSSMLSHAGRLDRISVQLATLFETGRDFWQASQHFLTASRNATLRFAFREAVELATRGLTCLRASTAVDAHHLLQRELDLTFARLVPLSSVEGYASPEAEKISVRLVELGEALNDVPATAAALSATWMIRIVRGECLAAKDAGVRLVALARAANNDVLLMNAHMHAQIACHHLGEFGEAQGHSTAAVSLVPRTSPAERRIMMFDPIAASLAESSRNLWITGHLARAAVDADEAVRIGRELRHPDSLAFALVFHGWLRGQRRDWTVCVASTDAGITIARASDAVQTLAWNRCVHGWGAAHAGAIETGLSELAAGIEASTAIMGQVALPQFYAMMAEVLLLNRDPARARDWIERAIVLMNANADMYFAAEVHRLAARCDRERGTTAAAREHLHIATDIARSQRAKLFELRAALDLGEIEADGGKRALAAALIDFPEPEPWPEVMSARLVVDG
ncbi:MAG TPA: AAA family ATPase [Vicinamibacterales bacterium]|nr:AAA family ATPase [Vicinamibacterales bacterium]